jgi:hydrogenase maturation protease
VTNTQGVGLRGAQAACATTLVAGVGNLFLGDDGFGSEVVRALSARPLPEHVKVADFGTRAWDLLLEVARGYERVILVDAHPAGLAAGSVRVFEASLPHDAEVSGALQQRSMHELRPHDVLSWLQAEGAPLPRLQVVGCEPESFGEPELGRVGLSPAVSAAVPRAVRLVCELLNAESPHA